MRKYAINRQNKLNGKIFNPVQTLIIDKNRGKVLKSTNHPFFVSTPSGLTLELIFKSIARLILKGIG